jgi:hypothetical protein
MTRLSIPLTNGLREMIASGRLTEDMIPDDFQWLILAIDEADEISRGAATVANVAGAGIRELEDRLARAEAALKERDTAQAGAEEIRASIKKGARRAPKAFKA